MDQDILPIEEPIEVIVGEPQDVTDHRLVAVATIPTTVTIAGCSDLQDGNQAMEKVSEIGSLASIVMTTVEQKSKEMEPRERLTRYGQDRCGGVITDCKEMSKRVRDVVKKRIQRSNKEYRQQETEKSKVRMAVKRNDPEYREQERLRDRERRAKKRRDSQVRENERDKDRIYKQRQRLKNGTKDTVGESSDFSNAINISTGNAISESNITNEQGIMGNEGHSHIYEIEKVKNTEQLVIPGNMHSGNKNIENEESYVIVQNLNSDMDFRFVHENTSDLDTQTTVICVNTEPQRMNPSNVINNESTGNNISCINYDNTVKENNITGLNQTVCIEEASQPSKEIPTEQSKSTDYGSVQNESYKADVINVPKSDNSNSKYHGCIEINSNMDADKIKLNSTDVDYQPSMTDKDNTTRSITTEPATSESDPTTWEQNESAILGLKELGVNNSHSYHGDNVITLYNEGT